MAELLRIEDLRAGYGEGSVLSASDAKAAGLIDRIDTMDGTLARVLGRRGGLRAEDGEPTIAALVEAERTPAPELVDVITFDRVSDAHPAALAGSLAEHQTPHAVTELALAARSASPESKATKRQAARTSAD